MALKTFRIDVEQGLDNDGLIDILDTYREEIEDFIMQETKLPDPRGVLCADSFKIEDMQAGAKDGEYHFNYQYEWTAYHGCRDRNTGGTEYYYASFVYHGSEMI